jgi:hypothetical protein
MTEQTPIQPPLQPAPEEETRAAHAVPSTLVNRFHLTAGDAILRLSFGEQIPPGGVHYHQAVTMPRAEAILMAQMILDLTSRNPSPADQITH